MAPKLKPLTLRGSSGGSTPLPLLDHWCVIHIREIIFHVVHVGLGPYGLGLGFRVRV